MRVFERFADVTLEAIALSTESQLLARAVDVAIDALVIPAALVVATALLASWEIAARRADT